MYDQLKYTKLFFFSILGQSVSGCTEYDYPKDGLGMPSIAPLKSKHKIPLPGALLEQWNGNYLILYLYCSFINLLYNVF